MKDLSNAILWKPLYSSNNTPLLAVRCVTEYLSIAAYCTVSGLFVPVPGVALLVYKSKSHTEVPAPAPGLPIALVESA